MKIISLTCFLLISISAFANGYILCGDDKQNEQVGPAKAEIVRRLMAMRDPDWFWETAFVPIVIQLAAPEMFFGRNYTEKRLEDIVSLEFDLLTIKDLAEYSYLARALCMDPTNLRGKNLLINIHAFLNYVTKNMTEIPSTDIGSFSMSLAALCLNNYPIQKHLVDKVLAAQNSDGSFGPPGGTIFTTTYILRPIWCLTQMHNPSYDAAKVYQAMLRMREFIITKVNKSPSGAVFIGENEEMSTNALIGLWKSKQPNENPTKWSCRAAMDTLGVHPRDNADIVELVNSLLRITATDLLDLQSDDYKCIETDPIPTGYKPKCNMEKPETCTVDPK